MSAVREEVITLEEAVELGVVDSIFYSHFFFPKTVRQGSPEFHRDVWSLYENPSNRFANAEVFRGGAKTTLARLFMSKRTAYGISHTILFIGPNKDHATKSVEWLMQQVEYNKPWAAAFGLRPGNKWTSSELEIYHKNFDYPIRIMAMGITGSIRGINVLDYRPDLIIVDDPCDEENTATPEARQKTSDLFFGAIKESLVPASEDPSATLALLQTPLDGEDLSAVCSKSSDFASLRIGILTSEDETIAASAWPARWTKEEVLADKQAAIDRNQLSLWMREKMCLIVARETSAFLLEWLMYLEVLPVTSRFVMAIDPAPILSDKARMTGQRTDLQAVMVKCYAGPNQYVVEYSTARDEDPEELSRNVDRLARKYPVLRCGVEGTAYQRTLKWFLEREMKSGRCRALHVMELPAVKGKHERIIQAHTGPASQGQLHVHRTHSEFIGQFGSFPNCTYKDLLDVSAMCDATMAPHSQGIVIEGTDFVVDETHIPELEWNRPAP